MSHLSPCLEKEPSVSTAAANRFQCGSLVYTKAGLVGVFFWLLLGDFTNSLKADVFPNVLPLLLKSQGATNTFISLFMITLPSAMNFVMNPIISTASDRLRSRWGRRIPFLLIFTPVITLFLALLGLYRELGVWVHGTLGAWIPSLTLPMATIGVLGLLITFYSFFNLFIGTVFWYLFNDVVPSQFMGRFLGCFRVIGALAALLFNFFLLKYAESHTTTLFFCVAILFGTTFMLMAWKVKEGDYPPPPPASTGNMFGWVRVFFNECLHHPIFRRVFVYNGLISISNAVNSFALLMALSIGLNLDEFGKVAGAAAGIGMLLMYPMGSLVDRFHPLRVMLTAKVAFCLVCSIQFVFLFHEFPKSTAFWIYAGAAALAIPISVANTAAGFPMLMRLFPHDRFGQFCAANAMCSAAGTAIGGLVAGIVLDQLRGKFGQGDFCYRFVPVWSVFFTLLALVAMARVFREWKRLGVDENYRPPGGDSFAPQAKPTLP